ncbi:MAG TPA: mandelate racemase/muconate lactonizing enzyme family protein [Beijerinckiaceae bacterium]|nr:mandelate racemase/muconate lactonizing enzyme family protein [Beijerinckiaceae bacterium]
MTVMQQADVRGETASDLEISAVEVYRLKLPYKNPVSFHSVKQSAGEYVLLRLVLADGRDGIAESICRPQHSGEDATAVAYQIETFFKPLLIGADPLAHLSVLQRLGQIKMLPAAKALVDIALWDLRGKILEQPVWRLLGGERPKPIPLTWIAHGNTVEGQIAEAKKMMETHGYRGMKLKTWRRSFDDVRMVEGVRKAVGDDMVIYVDGNGSYTETEARTILAHVADFNVSFMEEPCQFADPLRQAAMASVLPVALLGDQSANSLQAVNLLLRLQAVGAVSVKLRRTGLTESLKIIALCEAAGVPVVLGTDSESRIAAMPRMHLRAAIPHLDPWPTETHFFDKLADDVFSGEFQFKDGTLRPNDAPGFGASFDRRRLEQYAF